MAEAALAAACDADACLVLANTVQSLAAEAAELASQHGFELGADDC